ncbi:MAG TPA: DUF1385 domain-containing protein [Solirubrobacteraceae bacterium]|jgi:uncharacterized protein YqhQ
MSSRLLAGGRARVSGLQATAPERVASAAGVATTEGLAEEQLPDGELRAKRDAPLGGQAVLEGVMMRGVRHWAVAVRKPLAATPEATDGARGDGAVDGGAPESARERHHAFEVAFAREGELADEEDAGEVERLGEIEVSTFELTSALARHHWLRLPVLRGIVALGGSLAIGFKALGISANAQLPPGEGEDEPQEIGAGIWAGTIVVSLVFAIGLFFLLPLGLTSLVKGQLHSSALFWIVEGCVRTAIFLGYMVLLSRIRDLRRVFEYHGAEHKTISCFEAGLALTPENAQRFSRLHPRCGTSFLLIVMVVSIFVFGAVGLPAWYLLVATRILGVPIIAGISFEIIKFAGKNRNRKWVQALMWPGLKLQLLTTREPDLDQLTVAIAALDAVLALETPGSLDAADLVGVEVVA